MAMLHIMCDLFKDKHVMEVIHFNHMARKESVQEVTSKNAPS